MAATFEEYVQELLLYFGGDYPKSCTENTKRAIRRRAKFYSLFQGTLYYVGGVGQEKRHHGGGMAEVISSPEEQRQRIHALHVDSGAHFGRDKTLEKALKRYYWPGIVNDVKDFIKTCDKCQRVNKPLQKPTARLHPVPVSSIWKQVGVDVIGPLHETTDGNKYIITLSDYLSKWPEAKAVKDKSAQTIALFLYEVMVRLGCFKVIITDQGREFVNELNRQLFQLTGTEHRIGSAYHPQTNGLDERFNQTLQQALIKVCNERQDDWDQHINPILFGYRTSVHASTNLSPFFLMYGRDPVLPIDLKSKGNEVEDNVDDISVVVERMNNIRKTASSLAKANVIKAQQRQKKDYDRRHQSNKIFEIGSRVLLKNTRKETRKGGKLEHRWTGPYVVSGIHEKGLYTLADPKTRVNLKRRVNSVNIQEYFCRQDPVSDDSSDFQNDLLSHRKIQQPKSDPKTRNTCYLTAVLQVISKSGVVGKYVLSEHHIPVLEALRDMTGEHINNANSINSAVSTLKVLLPSFNNTLQQDALEFVQSVIAAPCTNCMEECSFLKRFFTVETHNELTCTNCGNTWKGGTCRLPTIPLDAQADDDTDVAELLAEFWNWSPVAFNGICDQCGLELQEILISPVVSSEEDTPTVLSLSLKRWNGTQVAAVNWEDEISVSSLQKSSASIKASPTVFLSVADDIRIEYNLFAMLCHKGNYLINGHYVSVIRTDDKWIVIDGTTIAESTMDAWSNEVCGCFYKKGNVSKKIDGIWQPFGPSRVGAVEMDNMDFQVDDVDLHSQFEATTVYLDGVMNGKISSNKHEEFITGACCNGRKVALYGSTIISPEGKEKLTTMLRDHYEAPVEMRYKRSIFSLEPKHHFRFPHEVMSALQKLGYVEVELKYLMDVLVLEAIAFIFHKKTGCTIPKARDQCSIVLA